MSSDSVLDRHSAVISRLLDPAFGFFVWAGHLILIYVVNAVSCVLGITAGDRRAESLLVAALAAVTIVAAVIVGVHGLRRYRERRQSNDRGFLHRIAVGQDAVAALAIVWQLIPIFMSPVCR